MTGVSHLTMLTMNRWWNNYYETAPIKRCCNREVHRWLWHYMVSCMVVCFVHQDPYMTWTLYSCASCPISNPTGSILYVWANMFHVHADIIHMYVRCCCPQQRWWKPSWDDYSSTTHANKLQRVCYYLHDSLGAGDAQRRELLCGYMCGRVCGWCVCFKSIQLLNL